MQSPPPVMFPPRGPAHGSFPLRTPEVPVPTPVEDHTDRANLTSVDLESHQFRKATKEITKPEQIQTVWLKSQAYQDLLGFLQAMSTKVNNVKITDNYPVSKTVESLVSMLDDAHKWIKDIPPTEQPQRFGNMAYREWFDKLLQETPVLLHTILEEKFHPAIEELSSYFTDSFGNRTRIDYGTGHEMTFVAFLICLYKIGALVEDDAIAIVLRVFQKYLIVVRALQLTYRMEPAGSQGVWSLDDYQFISFIWGSAQFIGNKRLKPKCFTDEAICEAYHKDYIFLGCINYINSVKTGPFAEHSNQLWNISGTPLWQKVNTGLIKMYKAEVLCKFPVIQHFLCGSLLTSAPVTKTAPTQTAPIQMAPTQTAPMQTAPTQTAPTQSDNDSAGNT